MRAEMKTLALSVVLLLTCSAGLADESEGFTIDFTPICYLEFESDDGRQAVINFCGETLTYSGELSVGESAKLFFDAYRAMSCEKFGDKK